MTPDLRLVRLATCGWAITLLALHRADAALVVVLGLGIVLVVWPRARLPSVVAAWVVMVAALTVTWIDQSGARASPAVRFASDRASATAELTVRTQGEVVPGRFGARLRFEGTLVRLDARGRSYRGGGRVTVMLDDTDATVTPGSRVRVSGRLLPGSGTTATPLLAGRGPPTVLAPPGTTDRVVNRVRRAVREAAAGLGPGAAALVPALVDGDEGGGGGKGTAAFTEDFRTAGMTHLLAVSGTNLTIILGGLIVLARWCGVRARGLFVTGLLGVLGFVLLAGPEPSVLRAAAMGTVALIGLGRAGPGRGLRALGAAVLALVLISPPLAEEPGFVLSVIATGGILLLAPRFRVALGRWLPGLVADAIAIPMAAQLACTPVVAGLSGQVSLVAVVANIIVAPFVAPTTVLGLAAGLIALVRVDLAQVVAVPAGWCADLMIAVARHAAGLPVPAFAWGGSLLALTVLGVVCALMAWSLPWMLGRPGPSVAGVGLLVGAVLVPLPTPGWPPHGWVLVACAVGQGDAMVLRAGPDSAVVVDAGPDPVLVNRCLRRLGIRAVPLVVLTHFHADHVDGLPGVLRGRQVASIEVSPLAEPASGARAVRDLAARAGIPIRVPQTGERARVGDLAWQVLGPVRLRPESDSPPNDASVVLLVTVAGVRILMLGDEEAASQGDLRQAWPDLRADVLKVAHHGSARQDADLIESLGARLAVIGVGRDNGYGHPAPATLDLLRRAGMLVRRTDLDGDVAVTVDADGGLGTVTRANRH